MTESIQTVCSSRSFQILTVRTMYEFNRDSMRELGRLKQRECPLVIEWPNGSRDSPRSIETILLTILKNNTKSATRRRRSRVQRPQKG